MILGKERSQRASEEDQGPKKYKVLKIYPDFAVCEIIHENAKYKRAIDYFEIFERGKAVESN